MHKQKLRFKIACLGLLVFLSGASCHSAQSRFTKGRANPFTNFWVPLNESARRVYDHSILKGYRSKSDCQPNCPQVDVWHYQYKDPKTHVLLNSEQPIASKKAYWKVPFEARIIAVSLFGDKFKYVEGLQNFMASNNSLKKYNRISPDESWGYETFTFRVYTPKRNPKNPKNTPIKGELPEAFLQKLLDMGCEVAFVDNGMDAVGLDASFWRFMVAAEQMKPTEQIRYLIRDADWFLTGAEALMVGEWINSSLEFHRSQLFPACMGPLFAGLWGGQHVGVGRFADLKDYMKTYPYRLAYGDDEMFARDIIWPRMLDAGSILTHYFAEDFFFYVSEPYQGSCQRPTQDFCNEINQENVSRKTCVDSLMPKEISFPYMRLQAMDETASFLEQADIFEMNAQKIERAKKAERGLGLHPLFGAK